MDTMLFGLAVVCFLLTGAAFTWRNWKLALIFWCLTLLGGILGAILMVTVYYLIGWNPFGTIGKDVCWGTTIVAGASFLYAGLASIYAYRTGALWLCQNCRRWCYEPLENAHCQFCGESQKH